eukprot:287924_1
MECLKFLLIFFILIKHIKSKPPYCLPSNTNCWPTQSEINTFVSKLNGEFIINTSSNYIEYVNMTQDLLYRNRQPSFIVVCSNVLDIQNSILFASSHNIQISILSTGHSYSGRSVANFSLQINLSKMRNFKINKNTDNSMQSITVETGLQMGSIYGLVSPNILIGPDDPSVGPGGSSLRGGHSPLSPHFGLSSDFTLEYFMVDANANIIHVYNTSGVNQTIDDLFWSLKGGGGSTFGVIVNITFKVHTPESGSVFTKLLCDYSFYSDPITKQHFIGDILFNNLFQAIKNGSLDDEWGGYLVTAIDAATANQLLIVTNFYGNAKYAMQNGQVFFHLSEPYKNVGGCQNYSIYETFAEFMATYPPNTGGFYDQTWNDLIPKENLTDGFVDILSEYFNVSTLSKGYSRGMIATFQGGKVNSFHDDYTSVTPGFRHNQFEFGMGVSWNDKQYTNVALEYAHKWEAKFMSYGIGKYANEENYECGYPECDWKQEFYSYKHYNKLLTVKQKWDPNQVFW